MDYLVGALGVSVAGMDFQHVDVFADSPFTGNSLTVFLSDGAVTAGQMLSVTREFRHFESIFLEPAGAPDRWRARVFDLEEELGFAGHPVLGAAAVLHDRAGGDTTRRWTIELPAKTVTVQTTVDGAVSDSTAFRAVLDQGRPEYGPSVTGAAVAPVIAPVLASVLDGLGLGAADLVPGLDPAVVSTGLRYLVIPVSGAALARAAITAPDFAGRLAGTGAQFAYLLDPDGLEGRHWANDGRTEDVATGSAAGTVGAYLARAGRVALNQPFVLHQGRFAGRPSQLRVEPRGRAGDVAQVLVGGQVALVAAGTLRSLPGVTS